MCIQYIYIVFIYIYIYTLIYIVTDWNIEWPFGNRRGIRKIDVLTYPAKTPSFWTFISFGELRMSNWHVTKHRACQSQQVWDTEHRMGFHAQLIFTNSSPKIAKVRVIPSLAPKCWFFVEGSPKSFEHDFFEHLLSIVHPFFIHFHAFFQPFFIHA